MTDKDKLLSINDEGVAFFTHSVKITDNIEKTEEGFLICKNATFGREGYQDYLGKELKSADIGIDFEDKKVYKVYRDEKDVFNQVSMESANGKYLTINHPRIDVTPENYKELGKGHIMGTPIRDGENLVGDLFVSDPLAIELILSKKYRELSMGYKTKLVNDNGVIKQTNILYNHIALLERGRAGNARIYDEEIENMEDLNMNDELMDKILQGSGNTITINIGDVKKDKVEEEKEVDEKKVEDKSKKDEAKQEDKDKETKGKDEKEEYKPNEETLEDKKDKKEEDEDVTKKEDKEKTEEKPMNKDNKVNDAMFGNINQVNNQVDFGLQNNVVVDGGELINVLQEMHDSCTPNRLARDFGTEKEREQHIYNMGAYEGKDFIKKGGL